MGVIGVIEIWRSTFKRRRKDFLGDGDVVPRRSGSARLLGHRLSEKKRQRTLLNCNQPGYSTLHPRHIVPALAYQELIYSCGKDTVHGAKSSFYLWCCTRRVSTTAEYQSKFK
jgi:putative transposase